MPGASKKKDSAIRVTGIIVPVKWDKKGKPVRIAISTNEEEEYLIRSDKKGLELYPLMRRHVEVSGFVRDTEKGRAITIEEYVLRDG
ncbi:MAG: hypothetical protein COX16_09530 [Deltaproteobacteria bacterium CG23_combo_of_CG06-09_8_20_14_all_51_20]|nr:MAG: hypothetical protein COX16_09530 [Deltaproteobacteria bacterium CG23_combo_of_CG06-09_8_20_14_all_51_20]